MPAMGVDVESVISRIESARGVSPEAVLGAAGMDPFDVTRQYNAERTALEQRVRADPLDSRASDALDDLNSSFQQYSSTASRAAGPTPGSGAATGATPQPDPWDQAHFNQGTHRNVAHPLEVVSSSDFAYQVNQRHSEIVARFAGGGPELEKFLREEVYDPGLGSVSSVGAARYDPSKDDAWRALGLRPPIANEWEVLRRDPALRDDLRALIDERREVFANELMNVDHTMRVETVRHAAYVAAGVGDLKDALNTLEQSTATSGAIPDPNAAGGGAQVVQSAAGAVRRGLRGLPGEIVRGAVWTGVLGVLINTGANLIHAANNPAGYGYAANSPVFGISLAVGAGLYLAARMIKGLMSRRP